MKHYSVLSGGRTGTWQVCSSLIINSMCVFSVCQFSEAERKGILTVISSQTKNCMLQSNLKFRANNFNLQTKCFRECYIYSHSSSNKTYLCPLVIIIVIVNSRFLQRSQKRSHGKQLIHRRLSKTKSIGNGSDPENQAGRQSDGYGGWCLELRRGGRYGEDDE